MKGRGRSPLVRKPSDVKTTSKGVCLAVTMEGGVEEKKGENGTAYAMGVGVGSDGARVSFSFFGDAIEEAKRSLTGGSSCSGGIDFLLGLVHGADMGSFSGCSCA